MEEELNENELEERFYSMLHYVDGSLTNAGADKGGSLPENAPRGTLRRYWRTGDTHSPYQKVNTPKETPNTIKQPHRPNNATDNTKPKEEKDKTPAAPLPAHLSIFQSTVPQKNSIEIIEDVLEANVVELESSDEDEVIEVALPPKPTITIESSDEEEITPTTVPAKSKQRPSKREISTSPVPSVVSSVSDEFIRGDCIALNISSRRPDDHSFDFGLHGADLLVQSTPSKKKKRKKNKEASSTPVIVSTPTKPTGEECFATPKSKAKNKRQRTKSYTVTEKSIPNPDVYDSDSNQSIIDAKKNQNSFIVTDRHLPSVDVYESDSATEPLNTSKQNVTQETYVDSSDSSTEKLLEAPVQLKRPNATQITESSIDIVDLTNNAPTHNKSDIQENIVIGNVTGFVESDDYGNEPANDLTMPMEISKFVSTKVPAILYENLDFDNLKGKDKVCKNRRYSLTTLRAEMDKFYNESWGGENFNHREIQKNMSRDKSLWAIDPKDRMPGITKRKTTCNYCGRVGHRDDTCRFKPPVCYMCGHTGHVEPRCPSKICVNCGSPHNMYSTMCRNCCHWGRVICQECGQNGHPSSHCPDLWRRYHNTTEITGSLKENRFQKNWQQMFCSGCTRRGHLVHTCRVSLPFSGLPLNSPYVCLYAPKYQPTQENIPQNNQETPKPDDIPPERLKYMSLRKQKLQAEAGAKEKESNKRQSKSPTAHETHVNKKRNLENEITVTEAKAKSPNHGPRELSQSKETETEKVKEVSKNVSAAEVDTDNVSSAETVTPDSQEAPDFIPITSTNRDRKGQIIQDNEVSDTTDVVTSSRIYLSDDIINKLKSHEGKTWLKETTDKFNVNVQNAHIISFLSIKGKLVDQEAFQAAFRDWAAPKQSRGTTESNNEADAIQVSGHDPSFFALIPKNRKDALMKVSRALERLKLDLGHPNAIYETLNFLQNRHQQLLKQKVVNPQQLVKNREKIKKMLKKLNLILLGQAGLADGSKHIAELYSLQDKLIKNKQEFITQDLRAAIGKHYHSIFTANPRNDYRELIQSYKEKKAIVNAISSQQKGPLKESKAVVEKKKPSRDLVDTTMDNLLYLHKKLKNFQPNENGQKKMKVQLVGKIYSRIVSFSKTMTSKKLRKAKNIQNQTEVTAQLEENRIHKRWQQMFCSGCTRRGHLVHTCRVSLPFSGLPINSPYVCWYAPTYQPTQENIPENNQETPKPDDIPPERLKYMSLRKQKLQAEAGAKEKESNKRQSKSPTAHETHVNKKRNLENEITVTEAKAKSPNHGPRELSQSKETETEKVKEVSKNVSAAEVDTDNVSSAETVTPDSQEAPDFIPITSTNRDRKGQIIQDNEVSDTTDVVTSSRIYLSDDIINKLKSHEGKTWLKETTDKFNVNVQNADIISFLGIKGKLVDQEAFQAAFRDWAAPKQSRGTTESNNEADAIQVSGHDPSFFALIPKNRKDALMKVSRALERLKLDLGHPNAIYETLNFLQNRHQQLLKQKVVNPQQLVKNREKIKKMLKKLNLILLGQAGLADGSKHIAELYSLQDKLIKNKQEFITQDLRAAIGKHYHSIFTANPRNDYRELIQSYKEKKAIVNAISSQQKGPLKESKAVVEKKKPSRDLVDTTMDNLLYLHKKLKNFQPNENGQKKMKVQLVGKIYSRIVSFSKTMTSKKLRKAKNIQNQTEVTAQLEENRIHKRWQQMFCSGCTRRGHLVHTCRVSLPFSGLPINSPYVCWYAPTYQPTQENIPENNQETPSQENITENNQETPSQENITENNQETPKPDDIPPERLKYMPWRKKKMQAEAAAKEKESIKRQSKSPTAHETHVNKKRNVENEVTVTEAKAKNPNHGPRKLSQSKETETEKVKEVSKNVSAAEVDTENVSSAETVTPDSQEAPDFIPITSTNRDTKGQIIQDNEVSDTTDVVTSSRIYVTNDIIDKLKTNEGKTWLKETTDKFNVNVQNTDINSFLSIKGKLVDQEAFQAAFRDWAAPKQSRGTTESNNEADAIQVTNHDPSFFALIPINRKCALRQVSKALGSLELDLGHPNAIYKDLNILQNRHQKLLKQKVVNPQKLVKIRKMIKKVLKKLNLILLGQAGLADGSKHIAELYLLQKKLIKNKEKSITQDLRAAIGKHYHIIFTANPRNDYRELIQSYKESKQSPYKEKKPSKLNANKKKAIVNAIPPQQKGPLKESKAVVEKKKPSKHLVDTTINKLIHLHKKLKNFQPNENGLEKTKVELVRKIYSRIASFSKNASMTATLRKAKKIQKQAESFLHSV